MAFSAVVATLALAAAACGAAAGPPAGPKHDPTNSAEAPTKCPEQAKAAKEAREAAIGEEAADVRAKAAATVFAHAECERKHFDTMLIEATTPEEFKLTVNQVKAQFYTAEALYQEAARYDIPEWVVAAFARAGDLYTAYAQKLRKADPGPGIEGADRAAWQAELDVIAEPVDAEAVELYAQALDVAAARDEAFRQTSSVAPYVKAACSGLGRLAPRRQPEICAGQ